MILDFSSHQRQRITDPFIFELLAGVSEALSIRNQDLLLSPPTISDATSYKELISSRVVDGFIFLGQGANNDMFNDLAKMDVPIVVWGANTNDTKYCTVGSDNFLGGFLAGERFVQHSKKNILFVGNTEHTELLLRRDGLEKALSTANYNYTFNELQGEDFSFNAHYNAMMRLLSQNPAPDAIRLQRHSDNGHNQRSQ